MRTNKAILDEAARSVRRTFIGSVAGTICMFAVVGAAGAYGIPERLTAHAFTVAIATWQSKFSHAEHAAANADHPVKLAGEVPVSDAAPAVRPARGPVVRTLPEVDETVSAVVKIPAAMRERTTQAVVRELPETAAPRDLPKVAASVRELPPPAEAPKPAAPVLAMAAPVEYTIDPAPKSPPAEAAPVAAAAAQASVSEPATTASAPARALPSIGDDRVSIPAPLMFGAPKVDDIPRLTEMPKTEAVVAEKPAADTAPMPAAGQTRTASIDPVQPVPAASPAPAEPAKVTNGLGAPFDVAVGRELPKLFAMLPLPKPPLSPAQRLELQGKDYDKAEKCLAQAIYFEARAEPLRGQQAVAQVVLNRVFSPHYPKDVCSVVFQNSHRHLSCQFTFTCDGKPEAIRERGSWARATRIAKQVLNAQVWLPEVNKATHYHASYVRPNWIRDMKVMVRYGLHTFYRPRNWGDGANEPHWSTAWNAVKPATAAKHAPATSARHAPGKKMKLAARRT